MAVSVEEEVVFAEAVFGAVVFDPADPVHLLDPSVVQERLGHEQVQIEVEALIATVRPIIDGDIIIGIVLIIDVDGIIVHGI